MTETKTVPTSNAKYKLYLTCSFGNENFRYPILQQLSGYYDEKSIDYFIRHEVTLHSTRKAVLRWRVSKDKLVQSMVGLSMGFHQLFRGVGLYICSYNSEKEPGENLYKVYFGSLRINWEERCASMEFVGAEPPSFIRIARPVFCKNLLDHSGDESLFLYDPTWKSPEHTQLMNPAKYGYGGMVRYWSQNVDPDNIVDWEWDTDAMILTVENKPNIGANEDLNEFYTLDIPYPLTAVSTIQFSYYTKRHDYIKDNQVRYDIVYSVIAPDDILREVFDNGTSYP